MKKTNKTYEVPKAEVIVFQPIDVLMSSNGNNGGPSGSYWHGATLDYESEDIP